MPRKGYKQTAEHRKKTTDRMKGNTYARGKEWSEESKTKRKGKGNPNWKGSNAKYRSIHFWLTRNYGKADRCDNVLCSGKSKAFDYCLIHGKKHSHNQNHYTRLCRSCHTKYDKIWLKRPKHVMKVRSILAREKTQRENNL